MVFSSVKSSNSRDGMALQLGLQQEAHLSWRYRATVGLRMSLGVIAAV